MISIHTNPQGIDDEYLKCLNLCYGSWGNQQQYRWYFRRKTAYPEADLIVLRMEGQIAAGSAVSYRRIALPNDNEIDVGIMTGSWTLPQFRGQGCFARIIESSLQLTAKKGGALLLAFVTKENASCRQLARAGAALFPTSYLISTTGTVGGCPGARVVAKSEQVITTIFTKMKEASLGSSRFIYPTEHDFCSQFIDRPGPLEVISDGRGNFGIIERKESVDILQLFTTQFDEEPEITECMEGFLNYARNRGRRLLFYSSRPVTAAIGLKLGFEPKAGYLAVLKAEETSLQRALGISRALASTDSYLLAQEDSPCFLGSWNVQSGDRL